jgi:hypothetical protein
MTLLRFEWLGHIQFCHQLRLGDNLRGDQITESAKMRQTTVDAESHLHFVRRRIEMNVARACCNGAAQ